MFKKIPEANKRNECNEFIEFKMFSDSRTFMKNKWKCFASAVDVGSQWIMFEFFLEREE